MPTVDVTAALDRKLFLGLDEAFTQLRFREAVGR
jgi:hypothetical protein